MVGLIDSGGHQSDRAVAALAPAVAPLDPTVTAEVGVALTTDLQDGDYPRAEALSDMEAAGIEVVRQAVELDQEVDIDELTANYDTSRCTANDSAFYLGNLDQLVTDIHGIGADIILDLDSPRLAHIKPKVLKCISYAIAKHYDGKTPGGPPLVDKFEGANEPNQDPEHFDGDAKQFAIVIEAIAHGVHAANPNAEVAAGGLRSDGAGEPPINYLYDFAQYDPKPTIDAWALHPYPVDWTFDTPNQTLAGKITKKGGNLLGAVSIANLPDFVNAVKYAFPDKTYHIWLTESGWRANYVDSNGVSPQTQANYDRRMIRMLGHNTMGITVLCIFHWEDEAAGPDGTGGWQTGVVHKSGSRLDQPPMIRNTPMTRMLTSQLRAIKPTSNSSSTGNLKTGAQFRRGRPSGGVDVDRWRIGTG
jgi:hypothetical protein